MVLGSLCLLVAYTLLIIIFGVASGASKKFMFAIWMSVLGIIALVAGGVALIAGA